MLSAREREVMLLASKGLSNKDIAQRLEITDSTVAVHLHHIYLKLGIRNRTMLAALASSSDIQKMGYRSNAVSPHEYDLRAAKGSSGAPTIPKKKPR
jgi:DNA-binding CsgD family transcriptional regulator